MDGKEYLRTLFLMDDNLDWTPLNIEQTEPLIQGMKVLSVEPIDFPLTDSVCIFFSDEDGKKIVALEIGVSDALLLQDGTGGQDDTGTPLYAKVATKYTSKLQTPECERGGSLIFHVKGSKVERHGKAGASTLK